MKNEKNTNLVLVVYTKSSGVDWKKTWKNFEKWRDNKQVEDQVLELSWTQERLQLANMFKPMMTKSYWKRMWREFNNWVDSSEGSENWDDQKSMIEALIQKYSSASFLEM